MLQKITTVFLSILTTLFSYAQDISRLKENNGFRKIKLGTNVVDYPSLVKQNPDNKEYFKTWDDYSYVFDQFNYTGYEKIGDTKIQRIFVKTVDSKIYEILVVLDKDDAVFESLKTVFGEPSPENIDDDALCWHTDNNIECTVTGLEKDSKRILLKYNDTVLRHQALDKAQADKKKKLHSQF